MIPHATHKFRVLLLNTRTQPSFDQTDDGVDAETSLSFFLSLFIFISLLRLFSRAHYWVNKYTLKMRVSSKELFSTLRSQPQARSARGMKRGAAEKMRVPRRAWSKKNCTRRSP